jgi:hypothetical protein
MEAAEALLAALPSLPQQLLMGPREDASAEEVDAEEEEDAEEEVPAEEKAEVPAEEAAEAAAPPVDADAPTDMDTDDKPTDVPAAAEESGEEESGEEESGEEESGEEEEPAAPGTPAKARSPGAAAGTPGAARAVARQQQADRARLAEFRARNVRGYAPDAFKLKGRTRPGRLGAYNSESVMYTAVARLHRCAGGSTAKTRGFLPGQSGATPTPNSRTRRRRPRAARNCTNTRSAAATAP